MDFSFDECMKLAIEDPEAFENYRLEVLKKIMDRARPECQQRMKGIQFRVDMEKRKSRTPMATCIKLNEMMLDFLYDELESSVNRFLSKQKSIIAKMSKVDDKKSATILPFSV